MGREIRRVPADWNHPTVWSGSWLQFVPLYEGDFDQMCTEWYQNAALWSEGKHPEQIEEDATWNQRLYIKNPELRPSIHKFYHEWSGFPPERREDYMGTFVAGRPCTHWQYYENTSEGTPMSPVFATKDELNSWLVANNDGRDWAEVALEKLRCVTQKTKL